MEKLNELFALCKASVHINYNENTDMYQTVEDFLYSQERLFDESLDITPEVRKEMIKRNQMITIQAYLNTPIGFYIVYHWDLESAVDEMLSTLTALRKVTNGN